MTEGKRWHDDDRFWRVIAPVLFRADRWQSAPEEVAKVLRLLEARKGEAILDLACGPGRHALELARRGFRVTAVDRTADYLEEAERRAQAENLSVEFVQEDMRTFCRPGAFHRVINLFTSFGYFEDAADDERVLQNVYRSLKPRGTLAMHLMAKEVLARIFRKRTWQEIDGHVVLEEGSVKDGWRWIETRWIVLTKGEVHEFALSHRLYSAAELAELLLRCGFAAASPYGNFDGDPYDETADRLVVVARKG
jgi:SAM-dependent methyltransferase